MVAAISSPALPHLTSIAAIAQLQSPFQCRSVTTSDSSVSSNWFSLNIYPRIWWLISWSNFFPQFCPKKPKANGSQPKGSVVRSSGPGGTPKSPGVVVSWFVSGGLRRSVEWDGILRYGFGMAWFRRFQEIPFWIKFEFLDVGVCCMPHFQTRHLPSGQCGSRTNMMCSDFPRFCCPALPRT